MFYANFILSKKGPLAKIWLAAHWEKKLTKAQIFETNVEKAVDEVLKPKVKMALRTTGHLLLGIVRIYSRKAKYLLADCNEAFLKIKMAFRPGQVDLPEDGREAQANAITLPEVFHDFDSALPDFNELEYNQLNQSRIDDITMKEDLPSKSAFGPDFGLDDFGDGGGFGDEEMLEMARDGSASMSRDQLMPFGPDGSRMSEALDGGGHGLDLDAPIDDFGVQFDEKMFVDDIFNDEALREVENDTGGVPTETAPEKAGGDETILVRNADESFALEPLDATVIQGFEKHRGKRRRRLVVDDTKNISGDDMKAQMHNYEDTVVRLDLAPPTKRLMQIKELGTVEKLFSNAGCEALTSKRLQKLYQSHLIPRVRDEDKIDRRQLMEELEMARNAELALEESHIPDDRLSVIQEDPEQLPLPPPEEGLLDQAVPSVSPIGPAPDLAVDIGADSPPAAIEDTISPKEKTKKEKRSRSTIDRSQADDTIDDQDEPEDRRWTKRTQSILNNLHNKFQSQDTVHFSEISKNATRKSAAQKFYTLLVLKKWQAIDVFQPKPYADIKITAGDHIDEHVSN